MKLEIPKIIEKLKLSDYANEWGDHTFDVWVNPTKEVNSLHDKNIDETNTIIGQFQALKAEKDKNGEDWSKTIGKEKGIELQKALDEVNRSSMEWYSIIWSQGEESNKVTPEEVIALFETAKESDPMFFKWICEKTIEMVINHRVNRKN